MITPEYFKYRIMNLIVFVFFIALFYGINYIITMIPTSFPKLVFFMFILSMISIITLFFIDKFGILLVFYLSEAFLGLSIPNLEGFWLSTIITFFILGLLYEVVFLLLHSTSFNKPISKILGISIANATIFISMGVLTYPQILIANLESTLNLSFLLFIITFLGAIWGFLIWHSLRNNKVILKIEHENI